MIMPNPIKKEKPLSILRRTRLYYSDYGPESKRKKEFLSIVRYRIDLENGKTYLVTKPCFKARVKILKMKAELKNNPRRLAKQFFKHIETIADERLRSFIRSNFEELPDNYYEYYRGGPYANLCVLCDDSNEHSTYFIDDDKELCTCATCSFMVKQAKAIEKMTTPALNYREKLYVENGELDPNIYKWVANPKNSLRCYFCENTVKGLSSAKMLIPITPETIGAEVLVCEKHYHLYEKLEDEIAFGAGYGGESKLSSHYNGMDNCPECNGYYPISQEEATQRNNHSTWSKHRCNKCTIKEHPEHVSKFDIYNRYIKATCSGCGNKVKLDKTLHTAIELTEDLGITISSNCPVCTHNSKIPPTHIVLDKEYSAAEIKKKFDSNYHAINGTNFWLAVNRLDLFNYSFIIFEVQAKPGKGWSKFKSKKVTHRCVFKSDEKFNSVYEAAISGYDFFDSHIAKESSLNLNLKLKNS